MQFADELNEFIEENKIERFEKDVNERFAYIIHTIGKETGNLMSKGGAIQKLRHLMNYMHLNLIEMSCFLYRLLGFLTP